MSNVLPGFEVQGVFLPTLEIPDEYLVPADPMDELGCESCQ